MCNGMNCKYEQAYSGNCTMNGRNIPEDAACVGEVLLVCNDCGYEDTSDNFDGETTCPLCGSEDVEES